MKRKVTELEQKLINDGWCLTTKRYTGKHSQKILCYEYHKTSDLRNDNKTYDLFIQLDQKRSQIVKYGVEERNMRKIEIIINDYFRDSYDFAKTPDKLN